MDTSVKTKIGLVSGPFLPPSHVSRLAYVYYPLNSPFSKKVTEARIQTYQAIGTCTQSIECDPKAAACLTTLTDLMWPIHFAILDVDFKSCLAANSVAVPSVTTASVTTAAVATGAVTPAAVTPAAVATAAVATAALATAAVATGPIANAAVATAALCWTVALTHGLSNPYLSKLSAEVMRVTGSDGSTGCGVELGIVFDRKEFNPLIPLHESWPISILYAISEEISLWGPYTPSQFMEYNKTPSSKTCESIALELEGVPGLPSRFLDPTSKRMCVLLIVPQPGVNWPVNKPTTVPLPNGKVIRLVIVRLLTHAECLASRKGGARARDALAAQLLRSSIAD